MFSIDNRLKYTPTDTNKAVWFNLKNGYGPEFGGNSLSVSNNQLMNAENNGVCYTNGCFLGEHYKVGVDGEGNSLLTGDGKGKNDSSKTFTLSAIETWALTY